MRKVASGQKGRNQKGFTLLELLVTIAIIGIVLAIGTPAVSVWLQRAQIQSETQKYLGTLSLARSTAISNNQAITISFTGPDADRRRFIDVFTDTDDNQTFSGTDVFITQLEVEPTSLDISIESPIGTAVTAISFDANGRLIGQPAQIDIENDNQDFGRLIDINPVGRAAVSEKTVF